MSWRRNNEKSTFKNLKIDKSNLFFINYSIKQLIYQDNLKEIDFFKFLKDSYLNHKNKKLIYYIYEKSKKSKLLLDEILKIIKQDVINKKLEAQYQIQDYNYIINNILINALTQTIIFEHIFTKDEINNIYKILKTYYDNYHKNIESTLLLATLYDQRNELKNIFINNFKNNQPKLITVKDKDLLSLTYYKITSDPYNNNPGLYRKMYDKYHPSILIKLKEFNLIKLQNKYVL